MQSKQAFIAAQIITIRFRNESKEIKKIRNKRIINKKHQLLI